ncbi:MAG: ribonuclease III [Deltaproteobacteria bacterium]|nr:MAG: ribonuclease III [Deltaproteobacteria bacterium]
MKNCGEKKRSQIDACVLPLENLEAVLGYHFKNRRLLEESLTHPTYAHEHPDPELADNQRLEFFGDAVLSLVVSHLLMNHFPDAREGELTRMRANLVSETALSEQARGLGLGDYIRLGAGEMATHGREKSSILADTLEAVMAAVYLDGGSEKAFMIIRKLFSPLLGNSKADVKTDLQELVQKKMGIVPNYRVMDETGPAHEKIFTVEVTVGAMTTTGIGRSKKLAEKAAAEKALKQLTSREA